MTVNELYRHTFNLHYVDSYRHSYSKKALHRKLRNNLIKTASLESAYCTFKSNHVILIKTCVRRNFRKILDHLFRKISEDGFN